METRPSAKNPRTAKDRADKAIFENFIEKTPGTAKSGNVNLL
jgi:hypothetical protein